MSPLVCTINQTWEYKQDEIYCQIVQAIIYIHNSTSIYYVLTMAVGLFILAAFDQLGSKVTSGKVSHEWLMYFDSQHTRPYFSITKTCVSPS